jgi:hypothetical protein
VDVIEVHPNGLSVGGRGIRFFSGDVLNERIDLGYAVFGVLKTP